jgi:hypothetical protein
MGLVDDHPYRWPAPIQALEHRSFFLLWLAMLVSNAGAWIQRVASAWLIYTMTGSETLVAALAAPTSQSVIPTAAGEDHIPNAPGRLRASVFTTDTPTALGRSR